MKQVNIHYDVDGDVWFSIVDYCEDGYKGILTDTIYEDGSSYTDWCAFVGTEEECKEFCSKYKK